MDSPAEANGGRGSAFLRVLRATGCPLAASASDKKRAVKGEDLDWMFEDDDARELLDRIVASGQDSGAFLTAEEARDWEELRAGGSAVLEGQVLQEAIRSLEVAADSSPGAPRLEDRPVSWLQARAQHLRDLSDAQSVRAVQAQSGALSAAETALVAAVAERRKAAEGAAARALRARQEEVLREGAGLDEALDGMVVAALGSVFDSLQSAKPNLLHKLVEAGGDSGAAASKKRDEEFLDAARDLFQLHFDDDGKESKGWLGCPDQEDRSLQAKEASRLFFALKAAFRERLEASASRAGNSAALEALVMASRGQNAKALDADALRARNDSLESAASALQRELDQLEGGALAALAERTAVIERRKVRAVELQRELQRLLYQEGQLGEVVSLLVSHRSSQSVASLLQLQEQEKLQQLRDKLMDLQRILAGWKSSSDAESDAVSKLDSFVRERDRPDVVQPTDTVINALVRLARAGDRQQHQHSRRHTQPEVLAATDALLASQKERAAERESLGERMRAEQAELEDGLRAVSARAPKKSSSSVGVVSGQLQQAIRSFELSVISTSGEWDAEKRKITPELKAQRRLWIDFLTNPKVLEANVEAMAKKASLAAAAASKQ